MPSPTSAFNSAWSFFQNGGIFMIPLALCSVVAVMAILYKFLSLSRNRVIPADLAREVESFGSHLQNNGADPVIRDIQAGRSTLARLCAIALKHRGKPLPEVTRLVESAAREETVRLHAGIGVLDVMITVAPLLGLLGAASGLVEVFQRMDHSTDNVAVARGIAIALNATIFGLVIAVPCVIAHSYFVRRIETITSRLEGLLGDFVYTIHQ